MSYERPKIITSDSLAEGVYTASGQITFSKVDDDGNGAYYDINIPAEWQNPSGKTKIIIHCDQQVKYFDCRTGDWTDGRMESDAAANNLWAYNYGTPAGPVSQFAIMPNTTKILSVSIVSE